MNEKENTTLDGYDMIFGTLAQDEMNTDLCQQMPAADELQSTSTM